MALEKHSDQDARVSASNPSIIAFDMVEDERVIHVEISIDVLHTEFGTTSLPPIDFFTSHREVIEGTAKQAYARMPEPSDHLQIKAEDFAAKGSRSNAADEMD